MKRILLLFSLLALSACSGNQSKLASFICELDPGEGNNWSKTLDDRQKDLDKAESLAAFHNEWVPWVFDKKTGQLYEYSTFEEAFIPLFKSENTVTTNSVEWDKYESLLSANGKKVKIKTLGMSKKALLGETILNKNTQVYNIEEQTREMYIDGKKQDDVKCIPIPVDGIDVNWLKVEAD